MIRRLFSLAWISLTLVTCSQTDDPEAESTLLKQGEIPAELDEISGMVDYGDLLWCHNDGDNAPELIALNKQTLQVEKRLTVKNSENTDWEELTQDEQHLYIGNFGNNLGAREDLSIYIIDKSDLQAAGDTITPSGIIRFSYEDQTEVTPVEEFTTPWDCEAFVSTGDSVLLFTKDWASQKTAVYSLPASPGTYTARFRYRADVGGLVTGASWAAGTRELLLLGYTDYTPFLVVVSGFDPENPVFRDSRKIRFAEFFGAQTEAICHAADGSVLVSCETSPLIKATLYKARY